MEVVIFYRFLKADPDLRHINHSDSTISEEGLMATVLKSL